MFLTQPNVAPVSFTGSLVSSDTSDQVQVRFTYGIGTQTSGGGPTATVTPVSIAQTGDTVDLGTTWSDSTWNGSHWSGAHWSAGQWNSASWDAASWTGSSWNGAAWTGSAWNGSHWSGSHWSGAHWSGGHRGAARPGAARPGKRALERCALERWIVGARLGSRPSNWRPRRLVLARRRIPDTNLSRATRTCGVRLVRIWGIAVAPGRPATRTAGPGAQRAAPAAGATGATAAVAATATPKAVSEAVGGTGGAGGCPPSTDAQMAAGQFPCNGNGANGGSGGKGGDAQNGINGGPGGAGGSGGDAQGAQGGAGGSGGNAQGALVGGSGGAGGSGGGCADVQRLVLGVLPVVGRSWRTRRQRRCRSLGRQWRHWWLRRHGTERQRRQRRHWRKCGHLRERHQWPSGRCRRSALGSARGSMARTGLMARARQVDESCP